MEKFNFEGTTSIRTGSRTARNSTLGTTSIQVDSRTKNSTSSEQQEYELIPELLEIQL